MALPNINVGDPGHATRHNEERDQINLHDTQIAANTGSITTLQNSVNALTTAVGAKKILGVKRFAVVGTTAWQPFVEFPSLTGVLYRICAGGGGGGGCAASTAGNTSVGGGGGSGAYAEGYAPSTSLASTENITIGLGGAGGSAGNNTGVDGGLSQFGSHVTLGGGPGGPGGGPSTGTAAGVAFSGTVTSQDSTVFLAQSGGPATLGYRLATTAVSTIGGTCPLGVQPPAQGLTGNSANTGRAGTGYGCGGGGGIAAGTGAAQAGGAGLQGYMIAIVFG